MKVLVAGAGVIGGYLCHVLLQTKNEVQLYARGKWKENLEENGLVIHHTLQQKTTTDHPVLAQSLFEQEYDVVFVVMQYAQMKKILPELAKMKTSAVVLVGNNVSAPEMEQKISELSADQKKVYFGFQSTAGNRTGNCIESVHKGAGELKLGASRRPLSKEEEDYFKQLFAGTKYKLDFQPDMDGWYKSHLAFILPIAYLSYKSGCDLKKVTKKERTLLLDAAREGFGLLKELDVMILPPKEDTYYQPGPKRLICALIVIAIVKTFLGTLCVTDHCRHAVEEMQALSADWDKLKKQAPNYLMPNWEKLYALMPDWNSLHEIYDQK
jgi:2-dehydropantoate 2-reductase